MKRYIIIFLLVAFAWNAQAQTPDTVPLDQPIRGYYYWDNNWAGAFYDSLTVTSRWTTHNTVNEANYMPEIKLRFCYIDKQRLEVIGIAGCYMSEDSTWYEYSTWQVAKPDVHIPEYFQLYTYGEDGSFNLAAQSLWDTASIKHYLHIENRRFNPDGTVDVLGETYWPMYECYFDQSVMVSDSFYVGATFNNNIIDYRTQQPIYYHSLVGDMYPGSRRAWEPNYFEYPSLVKYRFTNVDSDYVRDLIEVHVVDSTFDFTRWFYVDNRDAHMMFFPIFKTDDVEVPQTVLEEYVTMRPNPAKERVQVFSSFNIRSIEVHNIAGQLVERRKVDATQTVLDVSAWEKGPYVVTITTPAGTVTRKLVVQ